MESSLGCSRGQRVFGPAHRLGQWQRVEVSEGGTPADVTAAQRPPFTPFALSQGEIISFTQSHGLQCAITAPRSVVRRKGNSSARAIGTGHTFRPRSSARGLAGMKTAVSVSRASADTAAGRTPALTASAMGAERRPARGRRLWRACSYFWTPVVRAGLLKNMCSRLFARSYPSIKIMLKLKGFRF